MDRQVILVFCMTAGVAAFTAAVFVMRPVLRRGLFRCLAGSALLMLISMAVLTVTVLMYWDYSRHQIYPSPSFWGILDGFQTGGEIGAALGFLLGLGSFLSLGLGIPRSLRRQRELETLLATLKERERASRQEVHG